MTYRVRTRAEREANGFRLIHGLGIDHNVRRLQAHIKRLGQTPSMIRFSRKIRLKHRVKALSRATRAKR